MVHGIVCLHQQSVCRYLFLRRTDRDPDAYNDAHHYSGQVEWLGHAPKNSVGNYPGFLGSGFGKKHGEFVAAKTGQAVRLPQAVVAGLPRNNRRADPL